MNSPGQQCPTIMLLENNGEITPERMKRWSKSENSAQLWMWLVMEVKSDAVKNNIASVQFSHSVVSDSATPWIAARQASLSITNSRSSLRLTSIESVMPSSHLILCRPLLFLPPIPPSIRVFSNESTLHMRWPKDWSFSFSIIPSKKSQGWSPSEWTGWISLQSKGLSRVCSNTTVQKHQFFGAQLSSQSNSHRAWNIRFMITGYWMWSNKRWQEWTLTF